MAKRRKPVSKAVSFREFKERADAEDRAKKTGVRLDGRGRIKVGPHPAASFRPH
jgi:hypothetical protein